MKNKFFMPCLRGTFGNWVTYTCSMKLKDIAELVKFATELHQSERLSEMIQRELNDTRAEEIAIYLKSREDRFFSSLVVAVYDGEPTWHDIGGLKPNREELCEVEMPDYATETLGFLSITRDEKMFALDGQHRLAGIIKAIKSKPSLADDLLSVIVVAHKNSAEGIRRSRRLFTSLNKEAQPVSKETKIALDEDDECAVVTRYLVEKTNFIASESVSYSIGSLRDKSSFTTIGNIFDCSEKLFKFYNKTDLIKTNFFDFCVDFYAQTFSYCKELNEYQKNLLSPNRVEYLEKYRNSTNGGHLLFRPIGWHLYTESFIQLIEREYSVISAVKKLNANDLNLEGEVVGNILWSVKSKKIISPSAKKWKNTIKKLTM
jgi:DNA sulfur modification protein DndB